MLSFDSEACNAYELLTPFTLFTVQTVIPKNKTSTEKVNSLTHKQKCRHGTNNNTRRGIRLT
jgi:hypothetical protein